MGTPVDEHTDPFGGAFGAEVPHIAHHDQTPDTLAARLYDEDTMETSRNESQDSTAIATSAENTGTATPSDTRPKEKKRVGFSGGAPAITLSAPSTPVGSGSGASGHASTSLLTPSGLESRSHLPELSLSDTEQIKQAFGRSIAQRPRPVLRNAQATHSRHPVDSEDESDGQNRGKAHRRQKAREALQRGKDLERDERIRSTPTSRQSSPESKDGTRQNPALRLDALPSRSSIPGSPDEEVDITSGQQTPQDDMSPTSSPSRYADRLFDSHRRSGFFDNMDNSGLRSGAVTPIEERQFFEEYKPRPSRYRGGILGALLNIYHAHDNERHHSRHQELPPDVSMSTQLYSFARGSVSDLPGNSTMPDVGHSPPDSGASTPRGRRSLWYASSRSPSTSSLSQLIGSSSSLGTPAFSGFGDEVTRKLKEQQRSKRPHLKERVRSSGALNAFSKRIRPKTDEELRIKKHISEILQRQHYLIKLCKGLMSYGAPSHRLEEYMKMSARVLEIEAQFLYIPGAMLMSFNDPTTHTTELKLVKVPQGLDLGRLRDVHEIYKEVVHDRMNVSLATEQLNNIFAKRPKHNRLFLIFVYGLASVCVGPFAFGARPIDLPIAFMLGALVGILQLYIAPASDLYANVFEIAAAISTSFLARAFGSIKGGQLFCFSALAQSSIALILPGYMVLLASLELQSKSLVAGSVRMVYAIIYSLFLGYGITLGTAVYGLIDHNATSSTSCSGGTPKVYWFLFVLGFTMCLIVINQAKWKQAPMMLVISLAGYLVNFFSAQRFSSNTQISNMFGALAIGVLANGYSRIGSRAENLALDLWEQRLRPLWKRFRRWTFHSKKIYATPKKLEEGLQSDDESIFIPQVRRVGYSLAAAAMLPAVFVQVPSGLAAGGSLLTGLATADQITNSVYTDGTSVSNVTSATLNTVAFNVGYSVIQVAIGITVGLFLSAIVVYPFGKKRSGLFSF